MFHDIIFFSSNELLFQNLFVEGELQVHLFAKLSYSQMIVLFDIDMDHGDKPIKGISNEEFVAKTWRTN